MALALDASTPIAVKSNASTLTTASFTPPAGAVLYVCVAMNTISGGGANHVTGVTDNRGTHLIYTRQSTFGTEDGSDVIVYLYTAPVVTSQAMTVTVTQAASQYALVRVLVITGADSSTTTSPVGAKGGARGRTTNITGSAAQYASTRGGSWGWLIYSDWTQSAVPTAGSAQAVDSSYTVAGEDTYAIIDQNSTTATSGTTVTMSTTAPTSSLQLSFIYFEMMPTATSSSPVSKSLLISQSINRASMF